MFTILVEFDQGMSVRKGVLTCSALWKFKYSLFTYLSSFAWQFRFADSKDKTLMIIGSIMALLHGVGTPSLMLIFGDTLDSIITNAQLINALNSTDPRRAQFNRDLENDMEEQAGYYAMVGSGVLIVTYIQVSPGYVTGVRAK